MKSVGMASPRLRRAVIGDDQPVFLFAVGDELDRLELGEAELIGRDRAPIIGFQLLARCGDDRRDIHDLDVIAAPFAGRRERRQVDLGIPRDRTVDRVVERDVAAHDLGAKPEGNLVGVLAGNALRALRASWPRNALRTLWACLAGRALRTSWPRNALRTLWAGRALRTSRPRNALRP